LVSCCCYCWACFWPAWLVAAAPCELHLHRLCSVAADGIALLPAGGGDSWGCITACVIARQP
jgi:hypothetical protein